MKEIWLQYRMLLDKFTTIPKEEKLPTFMEICKYPYSRREEICSRILKFFLDPTKEHSMGDLWLSALLENINYKPTYHIQDIKINTEENAYGKFIDITIISKDFVIAIENKLTAGIYNPFSTYKKYIETRYPNKEHKLILLSIKPIYETTDLEKLKQNEYINCTYHSLFHTVNEKVGARLTQCNHDYLTFMLDFMKTVNHMDYNISDVENDFFTENEGTIKDLINRYNNYNESVFNIQKQGMAEICLQINECTGGQWGTWHDWLLSTKLNESTHPIGIEADFQKCQKEPCGEFHIYITTWSLSEWEYYKEKILVAFPENILVDEKSNDRAYLHLPIIKGHHIQEIVTKLQETYNRLKAAVM